MLIYKRLIVLYMKRLLPFLLFAFTPHLHAQISMDYTMQTINFNAIRTANTNGSYFAGAFDNGSAEVGTYANGSGGGYTGDPGVALFRTLTTNVNGNAGTARAMQVGDEFTITAFVANSSAFFNNSSAGISFNGGTANSQVSNYSTNQRARFQINKDGNWFPAAGTAGAGYATPNQDVTFKIKLTSAKTANLTISGANGATTYDVALAGSLGSSDNIQSFAIWNQTSGSNNNMYWKNATLKSTGTVEIGNNNGTSIFDGAITDGFIPNSTTIGNANEVIKAGTGTITFAAANTYTGATRINGGSIKLSGSGTLGSGSTVYIKSGASLDLNGVNATVAAVRENGTNDGGTISLGSATLTLSGGWTGTYYQNSISGAGSLVKQGAGTLSLYGTQSYSGATTITGGTLETLVALASSSYTLNGGTLRIANPNLLPDTAAVNMQSGTFAVDNDETIGTLTISGGSVAVAAGKTLTINGTLTVNTPGAISLGAGAAIKFGSGGVLVYDISGSAATGVEWPAANGPASVTLNAGTVTLSGSRTLAGNLAVNAGTLDLGSYSIARGTPGGTLTVANGATLKIGGNGTLPANFSSHSVGTSSTVEYYGTAVVAPLNGQAYGNLVISGAGEKALSANIAGAAALTISGGVLNLSSYTINRSTSGGSLTLSNGATLKIGATNTFPANYATHSIGATSTVDYAGAAQAVASLNSSQEYGHLTLSGSGSKTLPNGLVVGNDLTIGNGVTVNISGGQTLTVKNTVINNGTFTIANNGNLLQQNNVTDSGSITVYRNSSALFRQDYTLWSSPVAGQVLQAFSPGTLPGRFYTYNNATDTYSATDASATFAAGKGYLIRMPNGAYLNDNTTATGTINGTPAAYQQGTASMVFNGAFTGVPNNGNISVALGTNGNGYTLVGNPYPSPIALSALRAGNTNAIDGAVWVWRKKNGSTNSAYCTINSAGIYTGNGEQEQEDPNQVIRTGQGFFVKLKSGYTSSTLQFTNSMRVGDTADQFFRMSSPEDVSGMPENHGVWLNLTSATGLFSQMYCGYIGGATNGADPGLDAPYINDAPNVLCSVVEGQEYTIQARALPFETSDAVPLKLKLAAAGSYTIAIDHVNGLFAEGQPVYLKDNTLGTLHNLAEGGYAFDAPAGDDASRFEIVYSNIALGTPGATEAAGALIYAANGGVNVTTGAAPIVAIKIFDLQGRLLWYEKDRNTAYAFVPLPEQQQALIVQVQTPNGTTTCKIIF